MSKIYVASSWKNSYVQTTVKALRDCGHEVYDFMHPNGKDKSSFSWEAISPTWEKWDTTHFNKSLFHPEAEKAFTNDYGAMCWADTCVLILPSGRSAHTEAGYMAGCGKRVFVYSPEQCTPELMYKIYDGIFPTLEDLIKEI